MNYHLNDAPVQSQDAQALVQRQRYLADALHTAWAEAVRRYPLDTMAQVCDRTVMAAEEAYEASVGRLQGLLGSRANCHEVDSLLWGQYVASVESVTGRRPRKFKQREEVIDYMLDMAELAARSHMHLVSEPARLLH